MTSRVTVLRNIRGHSYGLSRQKSTENPQLTVTVTVTVTYTVTVMCAFAKRTCAF